ncbi:hypothetical protein B0T25DRAFT_521926 [Lasiosphaeria hispida]|uniref:Uncharacterized protein n=1 Tax=Lasiosphaeria hispida TaxID=260671 RepID=A0AAJ0M9C5_9PEZI|nr:hypothetical protein B0T25DRAFT_521926 [Lasiosphaeria hispida]
MSKSVKFRRESPSGGSLYEHQRSDSGVGSFSDSEARPAHPDRAFAATDYDSLRSHIYALEQALAREGDVKEKYKKKAEDLTNALNNAHKVKQETEANRSALTDRVELLEQEKASLAKANKALNEENGKLKGKVEELTDELKDLKKSARRKSISPPVVVVSGAMSGDGVEDKKPRRSNSTKRHSIKDSDKAAERAEREKRHLDRDAERERAKENERLRKRFENSRAEESDANSSNNSKKSIRSRRDSYIEPLGQSLPRPQNTMPPPSPGARQQFSYAVPYQQPYQSTRESTAAPRVGHPSVMVYSDTFDDEDGNYHPYPLPPKSSRDRSERR